MPHPVRTTTLALHGVSRSYDHRTVLDRVDAAFAPGRTTGVVGENGSGKSTLLRLLAGIEAPDAGRVVASADGGIGHLPQESTTPPRHTVAQVVDEALSVVRTLAARMRDLEARMGAGDESEEVLDEYGTVVTAFELRGGYEADARVLQALAGLGLGGLELTRRTGELSGGQRSRLHLAALLASAPEVLLLDEPTNHLDDDAAGWLETHLRSRSGTTVVVSHDREFLDRVADELLEVDPAGREEVLTRYPGGYDDYLAAKARGRRRWELARAEWEADVDRLRTTGDAVARRVAPDRPRSDGDKMGYDFHGGRVQEALSGRVRANAERLRRLVSEEVPVPPPPLRFTLPPTTAGPRSGGLVEAVGIEVSGRLRPLDLRVEAGTRLLVTGPNGSGKSTLLDVLAGVLTPTAGTVRRRGRTGVLRQDPPDAAAGRTTLQVFADGRPGGVEEQLHTLLRLGLFSVEALGQAVGTLSTGGRRRLDVARLLSQPLDVLLLDEPTNHLAPQLVEELEAAVAAFPGAVVVVSHDRRFRRRWEGPVLDLTGV